jgi:soluble lytic murein transglycosylase
MMWTLVWLAASADARVQAYVRAKALWAAGQHAQAELAFAIAAKHPDLKPWAIPEEGSAAAMATQLDRVLLRLGPAGVVARHAELLSLLSRWDPRRRKILDVIVAHGDPLTLRKIWSEQPTFSEGLHISDPSAQERLRRIEQLVADHRSERAILEPAPPVASPIDHCRYVFAIGSAYRKLHKYLQARDFLQEAARQCEPELARRAMYLLAKVESIAMGLDSVPTIEAFATRFSGHSMVDDTLFWAGDLYQARAQRAPAEEYYRRVIGLADDHKQTAQWRLAWMALLAKDLPAARARLTALETARAAYWLGRISDDEEARAHLQRAARMEPLGFYGQQAEALALARGLAVTAPVRPAFEASTLRPIADPTFHRGAALIALGLLEEAAAEFERVQDNSVDMARWLYRAGALQEAQRRLRSFHGEALAQLALPAEAYEAAYPRPYGPLFAEHGAELPPYLLYALVREESTFDASIVSWAGAYGLTQLLPSAARSAAGLLQATPQLGDADALLDPALNLQLGATWLAHLLARYQDPALALVAYNKSVDYADLLRARHAAQPLDHLVESIGIRETRHYVRRVLASQKVYGWLYGSAPATPGHRLGVGQEAQ